MADSTFSRFADEIVLLLEPFADGLENPGYFAGLLGRVGLRDASNATLLAALQSVGALSAQCRALADEPTDIATIRSLLSNARSAFAGVAALNDPVAAAGSATKLGADLAEVLTGLWLARRFPIAREVAILLGLLRPANEQAPQGFESSDGQIVRYPFQIDRFQAGRLVDLVRDPVAALRAEYASAMLTDADGYSLADRLFPRLQTLLMRLGVSSRYGIHPDDQAELGPWAPGMAHTLLVYFDDPLGGGDLEAGLAIALSPASQGDLGLVVSPFGSLTFTRQVGGWTIDSAITAAVDGFAWGRHGPTIVSSTGATGVDASLTATLPPLDGGVVHVIGPPAGSHLEVGGVELKAGMHLSPDKPSLALSAEVSKAALVIAGGDGDGFVSDVTPSDGLRATFDLGIGWSSDKGLSLRGGAGLEANLPVAASVAGVGVDGVRLGLRADGDGLEAELSANLSAAIGPVSAHLERLGLEARLSFPPDGGALGVADVDFGFKPPSGVGLAIDAHGVLTGGGFLTHDSARGTYGGVLQLSLHDKLTLTGYGLIATRMPDGSRGYSLLIFITAEGFRPIPLGFGFMLESIGGMVGLHRTFSLEALRAGLKSDLLAKVLFPTDPVANAPAVLQALETVFPIQRGSYLLGLLAKITWFSPPLVRMDLALVAEFGGRTRLLALGRISTQLPTSENDLIRLNLDALGVLDFDRSTFEADAVLTDSRIARRFPVTGSAALRARWGGDSPDFVLAVGGLNPRFAAPAGFPQLERVAIALTSGSNPRLVCDGYFAVTPNTVQFGSHVALYAEAIGFSVTGDFSFDTLLTIAPPHFVVDFHAAVQLKRGSHNLFKVTLDGTLEGPLPLRLAARARFEILWFSFSVRFDFTLADGAAPPAPSVALEAEVRKALADPVNWSAEQGSALAHGVSFRPLPPASGPVLDPLGQIAVRQQVAPLNTTRLVDTCGGARVSGERRFRLAASLGGRAGMPIAGAFAPARYFRMSDDDKLAAPSFENMDAGVALGDPTVSFDPAAAVAAPVEYDEFVAGPVGSAPAAPAVYVLAPAALEASTATGAAARAPARRTGRARFRNPTARPAAVMTGPVWRGVQVTGEPANTAAPMLAPSGWTEGTAKVEGMSETGDRWLLVPDYELSA